MNNRIITLLTMLCLLILFAPVTLKAQNNSSSKNTTLESEHPPLSEATKKAIAVYKKTPSEANKLALLKALNEAYDEVLQNKKNNLAEHTRTRSEKIKSWMRTVLNGGMPPFMSLKTDNNKGGERQMVADAVAAYRKSPSSHNKISLEESLAAYYDAFLKEQQGHITETEKLRDARVKASLEYFASDLFQPGVNVKNNIRQEDVLAEIMCAYISAGAEIIPVNPEARVRERAINADISNARALYLNDPVEYNKAKLKEEISKAFQTAYSVRQEGYVAAQKKGSAGADALFNQMLDEIFLNAQFKDLTEQRNLYGRIDRMVIYGNNTYEGWTPRMINESQELAKLLSVYKDSPTLENKQAAKAKFSEIYKNMLITQNMHLKEMQPKLNSFVESVLKNTI